MKVRRSALKDTVSVRTRTAEGSYGDTLAPAVTVACLADETRRMVRDSNGQETVSELTLVLHPRSRVTAGDGSVSFVDPMTIFLPESEVTVGTRVTRVMNVKEDNLRNYTVAVEVTCG